MTLCLVVGLVAGGGCGGSGEGDGAALQAPAATTTAAPTTTTQPAATTTTTVPPYSFDGSVPAPELVSTGDDHVAIAQSLLAYIAWLKRHNPDPELLKNVYVDGTELMKREKRAMTQLASRGYRFYDVGQEIEVEVVGVADELVSCLVHERLSAVQLIDSTGRVVDEAPAGPTADHVVVLLRGPSGRWRITDISKSIAGVEVRL